jgi:hypothetical protein
MRRIVRISNSEFRRDFKPTAHHASVVAELWLSGPIKLTREVREELKMKVVIHRNKVIAKIEEGQDLPEGIHADAKIYSVDDLEGKSMKDLIKIYNAMFAPADRVKVLEGVEGDINVAQNLVWDALTAFEVAEKAGKASTPRVEKNYGFVAEVPADTKMPTQARTIVAELQSAGKPLTKTELVEACTGKIETKQPVERIVAFYQKRLVDEGYITMT